MHVCPRLLNDLPNARKIGASVYGENRKGQPLIVTRKMDLIGYHVGRLEVIAAAPSRDGRAYWKVRCSCPTKKEFEAAAANLIEA
jgi:hypothetical protein